MQTHRREEEEGDVRSDVISGIQSTIIEGDLRESESIGISQLVVSRGDEETGFNEGLVEEFMQGLRLESMAQENVANEEEFEFAFVCENPDGLRISAEESFVDGRIRPFYPVFGRNILLEDDESRSSLPSSSSSSVPRVVLVEERMGNPSSSSSSSERRDPLEGLAEGTYCVWRKGRAGGAEGTYWKSNSTGFSRLWRVKDLVMRSKSDGEDTLVFLNPKKPKDNATTTTISAVEANSRAKSNGGKAKAATGYHGRSDKNRRRSYLPYKVGFFANINGITRNVHPY